MIVKYKDCAMEERFFSRQLKIVYGIVAVIVFVLLI